MSRITFRVPNHNMVKQFDREDVCRIPELAGNMDVSSAGTRIAARMIVLCCVPSYVE